MRTSEPLAVSAILNASRICPGGTDSVYKPLPTAEYVSAIVVIAALLVARPSLPCQISCPSSRNDSASAGAAMPSISNVSPASEMICGGSGKAISCSRSSPPLASNAGPASSFAENAAS